LGSEFPTVETVGWIKIIVWIFGESFGSEYPMVETVGWIRIVVGE